VSLRKAIPSIVWGVLFLSFAGTTGPRLVEMTREAASLRGFSYRERRSRVADGVLYASVRQVLSTIGPDEPLAIILHPHRHNFGLAMFANYYLYRHRATLYYSRAAYNMDRRPGRPAAIAYVEYGHDPVVRRASYEEIRRQEIGSESIVTGLIPSQEGASFIVPIVASSDGPAPDAYTSEGVISNPNAHDVHVSLELMPARTQVDLTIAPAHSVTWNDLVDQLFGVLDVGWLRIRSDQPIRLGFWFVNRGLKSATVVPAIDRVTSSAASLSSPAPPSLWIVNTEERSLHCMVDGEPRLIPPMWQVRLPAGKRVRVEGDRPFIAFLSWRDATGKTQFAWSAR
jgi:hypothetical protein